MTRDKDLKRIVRARMKKTGESYTAARAQITAKASPREPAGPSVTAGTAAGKPDYAALAGMSDAVIAEKTGCTWEKWVKSLDYHGAAEMTHREIAALVHSKYKVADWWTQAVTVGYERIKGLRERGQRRNGTYEVGKSRTIGVPVDDLFVAWSDARARRRWLKESVKVRTANAPKSIRLGWSDGTIVAVGFTPKGKGKSSVSLQHIGLPDRDTADRMKEYWSDRLHALSKAITP